MGLVHLNTNVTFPKDMVFQGSWRTYQARLLDRLGDYLEDNRLHIVAAPGSGKTVFGLEVVRRIGQPTLILAPTITIRDQWIERLVQHFLSADSPKPDWVSTDLRNPELLTVATYQALHAICSGEQTDDADPDEENGCTVELGDGSGDVNGSIRTSHRLEFPESLWQFKTLLLDEAHHLKAEWWKTLTLVADHLKPTLVALTATPPYDVSRNEWEKYEELCGPVDAEVTVPELVLEGDLCPHQDYVYFSAPAPLEQQTLADFRASVGAFVERLRRNLTFASAVAGHSWLSDPNANIEQILDDPAYLSSMVIYLTDVGERISPDVLRYLGVASKSIPVLSLEWLEVLLTHCLYSDSERFKAIDSELKTIRRELAQIGAIERHRVVLRTPSDHTKLLTESKTKLQSIEEIVRIESSALKDELRCVVLTDFIRKTALPNASGDSAEIEDIGAVPIFEFLRRARVPNIRLGVLCGSVVIVPKSAKGLVIRTAETIGIASEDIAFQVLPHDPDYLLVDIRRSSRRGSVLLITSVFEKGGITVLVGTKALLGEGWDAPTINTLILATFVGSYVLSNQMRGRSIRIDPARPTKTANIWHLVCAEPGPFGPGEDYALLTRRCSAFVGVSALFAAIENGVDRLGLDRPPYSEQEITDLNARTVHRALDREGLRRSWHEALATGSLKQITHGLEAEEKSLPRGFVLRNTVAALLFEAGMLFLTIFSEMMRAVGRTGSDQYTLAYVAIGAGLAALLSLPIAVIAVWRLIRHGTPERSMKEIGTAVLETLKYEGSISASSDSQIHADRKQDGTVYCWISGGTGREQSVFLRTLRQILKPIENPRYLLARARFWRFFYEDYFAVPDVLARKKELAEVFAKKWRSHVGPVQLVYTRTEDGRKLLLRARMHSLAAASQSSAEHVSCWK